jgi:TolB-like protein/predicted Zn-dependent protease
MSFFAELKRRNVVRVSAAYLALMWVVVEITSTTVPLLNLPEWLPSAALWIGIIGFPFVAVFSWLYELTPEGLKRESEVAYSGSLAHVTARRLDYITIGFITLAIALFAADRFIPRAVTPAALPSIEDSAQHPPTLENRPAIAVLPFDNLSADPEQSFFADGLAEDLITRLASWRAFPIIARNSSFQFRGGNLDLKEVSAALGARYIVEGSVRRSGSRIRVAAQLIDASSGEHVWADTFDGEVDDVFALQDEISSAIAAPLVGDLNRAEAERARQVGTDDLEAWSLYQLGLRQYDAFSREGFAQARELFRQSIERDPHFATAKANLVLSSLWAVALGWDETPGETIESSLQLARSAVSDDPRDPSANAALAWAYLMAGDLENGLHFAQEAVDLNPSMPEALGWLSWAQLLAGDMPACIQAAERTMRLNPKSTMFSIVYDNLSQAYWQQGNYEEGLVAARRLLAELPDYYFGHVYVAMNAVGLGRIDEARAAIKEARRAQPDISLEIIQGMYGVERPEIDARRNEMLRQAGLE